MWEESVKINRKGSEGNFMIKGDVQSSGGGVR